MLTANGTKHLQDKDSPKPQMFHLPDDFAEANDLLDLQPDRAHDLYAKWTRWNEVNVPCRMRGYIDYHKRRDRFFVESIPETAVDAGYQPAIKGNFK